MIGILIVSFMMSALTIYKKHPEFEIAPITFKSFFNGELTSNLESEFEDKLLVKDTAVGLWGAISYGLLKTGNTKVVIGENEWLFTEEEFIVHPNARAEELNKINIIYGVNDYLQSKNIRLIVALIPSKARVYEDYLGCTSYPKIHHDLYQRFRGVLINRGIDAPNLLSPLTSSDDQTFMRLDTHWSPRGAEIIANIIAKNIIDIERPIKNFITEQSNPKSYEGDLEKYVPTGIFEKWIGLKPETYVPHTTYSTDDSGALFDDPVIPVTLVGTSYSAIAQWNFEGALKTALQADVLNLALVGKGPTAPMADFLKNTNLDNTNTKLVVWEIPERFIQQSYDDVIFPDFIMGENQ